MPAESQCQPVESSTRWSGERLSNANSVTHEATNPARIAPDATQPTVFRETEGPTAMQNATPASGEASASQAA